ncbi:hypothetical protein [Borborobacter arsenicus]|uniref:hypothetical protein n=1 Tax=Borborobacter arsenicus TaxID=1851146 RepID=UPI0014045E6E|nr:hypothetical protein [Pseudaminobacter arsenicus]
MFDFISRTLSTAFDVATLPVAAVADALPIDVDRTETYTGAKVRRIARNVSDATKALVE